MIQETRKYLLCMLYNHKKFCVLFYRPCDGSIGVDADLS